jgi:excisionase family DNA binding protein
MDESASDHLDQVEDGLYLLTIEQVAERLGVHHQTVRQYIASGELGWVNMGGERFIRRRIRVDQLQDFINRHTVPAEAG